MNANDIIARSARLSLVATDMAADIPNSVGFECIYVVGSLWGKPVKIGKATNPALRLSSLQVGNPVELFVHHLFWVPAGIAINVEWDSHNLAGQKYARLIGEWFQCDADQAYDEIEMACIKNGVAYLARLPQYA